MLILTKYPSEDRGTTMVEFKDIEIATMDVDATQSRCINGAGEVVLMLSARPSSIWIQYFNKGWKYCFYSMKGHACIRGNRLMIRAVPKDMNKDHLPNLKEVIAKTNQAYRKYIAVQKHEQEDIKKEVQNRKDRLTNIRDNLDI